MALYSKKRYGLVLINLFLMKAKAMDYMKKAIVLLFLVTVFGAMAFADEPQNQKELCRVTTPDHSVSAVWIGVDPNAVSDFTDMPLTYGVDKLVFEFSAAHGKIAFAPKGDLSFSDWSFNIFSPDYRFVALLQDRIGPYHIIPIENLRDYLTGKKTQFYIVNGRSPDGVAAVHDEVTWLAADKIEFTAYCCGGGYQVIHQIGGKTAYGAWKPKEDIY